jgi:hypothetical protein
MRELNLMGFVEVEIKELLVFVVVNYTIDTITYGMDATRSWISKVTQSCLEQHQDKATGSGLLTQTWLDCRLQWIQRCVIVCGVYFTPVIFQMLCFQIVSTATA